MGSPLIPQRFRFSSPSRGISSCRLQERGSPHWESHPCLIPAQFQGRGLSTGSVGCSGGFRGWKDGKEAAELTGNEWRWLHEGLPWSLQRGLALCCAKLFFPISTIPGVFPRLGIPLEPPVDFSHLQTCGLRVGEDESNALGWADELSRLREPSDLRIPRVLELILGTVRGGGAIPEICGRGLGFLWVQL